MQILAGKKVNDIATVSDETFALLILENIWDDMIEINIDEYYQPKKRKKSNENKRTTAEKYRFPYFQCYER